MSIPNVVENSGLNTSNIVLDRAEKVVVEAGLTRVASYQSCLNKLRTHINGANSVEDLNKPLSFGFELVLKALVHAMTSPATFFGSAILRKLLVDGFNNLILQANDSIIDGSISALLSKPIETLNKSQKELLKQLVAKMK